jgi:integrase
MRRKTKYPGVTQVAPGMYEIRAQARYPRSERRRAVRRVVQAASAEQAAEKLLDLRRELRGDAPTVVRRPHVPLRPTLTDYARSWLERRKARGMKPSTLATYAIILEQAILPRLGHLHVAEIRKADIEDWLTWASQFRRKNGKTRAPETVNSWLRVLKTLIRDAVGDLEIERDPTFRVKSISALPTRVTDDRPNSLTADELRRVLDAAAGEPADIVAMCALGFFTGMRFGELAALEWNDIREDQGLIYIRRSQWHGKVTTPKTGKTRSVPLHPIVVDALAAHRRSLVEGKVVDLTPRLVFPNEKGGYHYPLYLRAALRRILDAAGLEKHLSPHGMRRTFNNLMRRAHVDRAVLHATIGHSGDDMTEHYSHVDAKEKLAAVEQMVRTLQVVERSPSRSPDSGDDGPASEAPSS